MTRTHESSANFTKEMASIARNTAWAARESCFVRLCSHSSSRVIRDETRIAKQSAGAKMSEAELRAARAELTLWECVRDVLLGSSVEMGTLVAEQAMGAILRKAQISSSGRKLAFS